MYVIQHLTTMYKPDYVINSLKWYTYYHYVTLSFPSQLHYKLIMTFCVLKCEIDSERRVLIWNRTP